MRFPHINHAGEDKHAAAYCLWRMHGRWYHDQQQISVGREVKRVVAAAVAGGVAAGDCSATRVLLCEDAWQGVIAWWI